MSSHHGHIICLYAGRAVYCPKMATLQATLKAALECFGLETGREVHFSFPHADLAILVEISALAFKNVRDGAILYLCDGLAGPVYPHELAHQAQRGQARRPSTSTQGAEGQPAGAGAASGAAATTAIVAAGEASPANNTAAATRTTARAKRATRRSQRHAEEPSTAANANANSNAAEGQEEDAAPAAAETVADQAQSEKERIQGPAAVTASSSSGSPSRPVKRELIDEAEEELRADCARSTSRKERAASAGDAYFKRRRHAL